MMLRQALIKLSESAFMRQMATSFAPARRTARRFVAGETLDEAIAVVKALNAQGIKGMLNEVGESVTTPAEATEAAYAFHHILHRIDAEELDANISLKPSHLGIGFGVDFCYNNIAGIVETAHSLSNSVEIDIESSSDIADTLEIYHRLLARFGGGVRLALQAYLHRSLADAKAILENGGSIRLVKGAYDEPAEIAYQKGTEINEASKRLMRLFLTPEALANNEFLALGSHDPELIEWLVQEAETQSVARNQFEFQMLQGVRRDEQERLAKLGYEVRVYVPFGTAWYPYFMRRLAERPSNLWFFGRSLLGI